jgi:hypothetical protein
VLIDVLQIAWYDAGWQRGAPATAIERRILTNATRRAASATGRS